MTAVRQPDVYRRLASALRGLVREEHANTLSGVERFTVLGTDPLVLEHFESDLVLEDGDPDFTVGALMRAHMAATPLVKGDQVWVLREGQLWHLVDVAGADA